MRTVPALIILALGLALQTAGIVAVLKGPSAAGGIVCFAAGIVCYCGMLALIDSTERRKDNRPR